MSDRGFNALVDDIRAYGLREAIWTYQDKIVDGRNRYNACVALKIKPTYREWDGKGSLAAFVVSFNLQRRHLDESQRGMVAAKLSTGTRGGDRKSNNFKVSIETLKQSEAAELLNVSVGTVKRATKVRNEGTPETIAAVESGQLPVSVATQHIAAVSKYPELASPLIPQNIAITVAKNLDAMPDNERAEAQI